jgi:hypothetical protein
MARTVENWRRSTCVRCGYKNAYDLAPGQSASFPCTKCGHIFTVESVASIIQPIPKERASRTAKNVNSTSSRTGGGGLLVGLIATVALSAIGGLVHSQRTPPTPITNFSPAPVPQYLPPTYATPVVPAHPVLEPTITVGPVPDLGNLVARAPGSTSRQNAPAASSNLQPVPPPPTSTLDFGQKRRAIAPLSIETEAGTNYLLKFIDVANSRDQKLIFVRGGERYATKMPLGSYYIRAASGTTWYGKKDFFGPFTSFFRFKNIDGSQQVFAFTQRGNTINGLTIIMKTVVQGNLQQESISRDEFEKE